MSLTIAIDGLAASGKGTLAKGIAKYFGYSYLDTGLIYRAVAKVALFNGNGQLYDAEVIKVARSFKFEYLQLDNLRSKEIGHNASKIASIPEVRAELLKFQRVFALKSDGAVLDGRDIGTVILPNADLKIFVTADLNIRAGRRHQDFLNSETGITLEKVLEDLSERDHRDSTRQHSPLKISSNAHLIDTSELSIETAIAHAIKLVKLVKEKS
jgi:cytidylate kinase